MRRGGLVFIAALALLIPAQGAPADLPCSDTDEIADQYLCLINAERSDAGVRPLRLDPKLSRAATRQARDMQRGHHMSHFPGGRGPATRVAATGYLRGAQSWVVGETLGRISGSAAPGRLVRDWMASPIHRTILVSPRFRDLGIGSAGNSVAAEFANRRR